jgi:hypothetical protein|tara:strand:+ start:1270 stop:1461 length:192 start_codon:yes stop_codon:yes gene_type:complete
MLKKDLIALIAHISDDTDIHVAPTPNVSSWTNDIVPTVFADENGNAVLVLKEETTADVERSLV